MKRNLAWPPEVAKPDSASTQWQHAATNISLDFHGDPIRSQLVVFSDGNHHMALQETIGEFLQLNPDVVDVFYATTPPNVMISYLQNGGLTLGNLALSRLPHVFISPSEVMNKLVNEDFINKHRAFMQSRGNVLLIKKGNPKQITGIADILRDDVRLFISNPHTEKASYQVYRDTIMGLARQQELDVGILENRLSHAGAATLFGECIHHREAPQALYDDQADVAMVYYHLALRYTRIFADEFDFIPLAGSKEQPEPFPENIITAYHVGLLNNAGEWGEAFHDFLFSERVTAVYQSHGLRRL